MKRWVIVSVSITGVLFCGVADAQKKRKKKVRKPVAKKVISAKDISSFIFDQDLWDTTIADFEKAPENKRFGFEWQSSAQKGLRSVGTGFKMLDVPAGETVIISNEGKELKGISISFYNKGDNGPTTIAVFNRLASELEQRISEKLAMQPRVEENKGTVDLTRFTWETEGTSYRLEKSSSGRVQPEFLRFRLMSNKTAKQGEATADRTSLRKNVVRDKKTGDVYIDNIPMVDQGKKGYCACASAARIYQYYGRTTDQHEIAQLAGSSAGGGTSLREMVGSLKKVTGSLNSRVNILYEYPKGLSDDDPYSKQLVSGIKEMMRDVNSYQQLAKKTGKKGIPFAGEKEYTRVSSKQYISFDYFTQKCDPETFREVMMQKNSFSRFQNKIEEYIDQGIPVGWCLKLGLFPEPGLPQANGGHMRLIIGYNEEKKELIYSDSWGEGHAKKSMDAGKAFSMTNAILVLPPTK
ncbi:MAG: C39 family peptidase [Akkermansiaceae bacterium]